MVTSSSQHEEDDLMGLDVVGLYLRHQQILKTPPPMFFCFQSGYNRVILLQDFLFESTNLRIN